MAPSFGESLVQHTVLTPSPLLRITHQPSKKFGPELLTPRNRAPMGKVPNPPRTRANKLGTTPH
jgi:hypothetical protein